MRSSLLAITLPVLNLGFHERILELQKVKRSLADAVISADASLIRFLTAKDLTMLLS
ncbi:MAG: hypothetical protein JNM43_10885 [Planctomycetaceae bacterium]|nr:hypothetical protein [Planctomycetaceae bacterium]